MKIKKITTKTKFDKIMEINPEAGMILFEYGMHCVGCGLASMETLEQGCLAHGMNKIEIKELVERLNGKKKDKVKEVEDKKEELKIPERPREKIRRRRKPSLIQKIGRRLR
ncbi:MAG: DUF1858 domain-containing protein [Nanoarchaeota archaeon]